MNNRAYTSAVGAACSHTHSRRGVQPRLRDSPLIPHRLFPSIAVGSMRDLRISSPCGCAAHGRHENRLVGAVRKPPLPFIGYFYLRCPCGCAAHGRHENRLVGATNRSPLPTVRMPPVNRPLAIFILERIWLYIAYPLCAVRSNALRFTRASMVLVR